MIPGQGLLTIMIRLVMNNYNLLGHITALVQQGSQRKSGFTMKAAYQWILHGLVGTFQYKVRCQWERHTK
jgi:hypothetical protein